MSLIDRIFKPLSDVSGRPALAHAIGVTITVCLLVGGGVAIRYQFATMAKLRSNESEARALIAAARELHVKRVAIAADRESSKQELKQTYDSIPGEVDASAFLHALIQTFVDCDLQIRDAQPGAQRDRQAFQECEVVIRTEGSFANLCHAIQQTSNLKFRCRVSYLSLQTSDDGMLRAEIKFSIPVNYEPAKELT